jgi:hypothetical protein
VDYFGKASKPEEMGDLGSNGLKCKFDFLQTLQITPEFARGEGLESVGVILRAYFVNRSLKLT